MLLNYMPDPGFVRSMPQFLIAFHFLYPLMDRSLSIDEYLDFSRRQRRRWHWGWCRSQCRWMVGPGGRCPLRRFLLGRSGCLHSLASLETAMSWPWTVHPTVDICDWRSGLGLQKPICLEENFRCPVRFFPLIGTIFTVLCLVRRVQQPGRRPRRLPMCRHWSRRRLHAENARWYPMSLSCTPGCCTRVYKRMDGEKRRKWRGKDGWEWWIEMWQCGVIYFAVTVWFWISGICASPSPMPTSYASMKVCLACLARQRNIMQC